MLLGIFISTSSKLSQAVCQILEHDKYAVLVWNVTGVLPKSREPI